MSRTFSITLLTLFILGVAAPAFAAGTGYSDTQIKDLLFRLMNFAVFFIVLFWLLRKPVAKYFRDRREGIERNLQYLETQARNLEEQTEIMNKQIADIASERDSILTKYERMGQKEADRIIAEAKSAAENLVQKAQAAMDLEIKAARQALLTEIVTLSTQAATELVQSGINADDHQRLTAEFMTQVEKLKSASN
jgi:F-type H+-transporting ATPase subunit b